MNGMRTKKSPDIIPFAQSCTGGQNPLHGFARVDKNRFVILQWGTKFPSWFWNLKLIKMSN